MTKLSLMTAASLMALAMSATSAQAQAPASSSGANQRSAYNPYEDSYDTRDPERVSTTFEVSHEGELNNAYAGLGIGLALPGLIAFQGNFASFGAILPGLYMDLRLTGTTAGSAFGTGSPMWNDSFEIDMRVGYGSRDIDNHKSVIRDGDKRKIEARVPGAFGVAPYLAWRGRWGYNVQQIRLGIHVARETDVEVRFTDGRAGRAFRHWAFDVELSYSTGWQKGLGGQIAYDHWFNEFIYLRTEFGFARVNKDKFYPTTVNRYTEYTEVGSGEGVWTKAMLGFAFQFHIPEVTNTNARRELGEESSRSVDQREHSREVSPEPAATGSRISDVTPDREPTSQRRTTGCTSNDDCDDGVFCNGEETCMGGVCQPGSLPDDGIECTQLVCDEEAKAFRFEPLHGLCGDGIFCNGTERCDPNVGCVAGTPIPVDDGDPCTTDSCNESLRRVVNEPIPGCQEERDALDN